MLEFLKFSPYRLRGPRPDRSGWASGENQQHKRYGFWDFVHEKNVQMHPMYLQIFIYDFST